VAKTAILAIRIISDAKGAQKGFDDATRSAGKFESGLGKASTVAAAGLAGMAVAGAKFAKQAAEDQASAAKLAKSLKNTAKATDATVASVEDWITAQGKALGVADDQLRPAMATLATATGDVAKAQELSALAMDLAAAKGIPVEQAASAIAKAYAGQTTAIGRLVPGIDKAALASGDFAKVQEELAGIVGGQAAVAAGTAEGQMARLQLALSETAESIGAALLPIIEALLPKLQEAATWAQENSDTLLKLGAVVAGVAAGIVTMNFALKAYRAAQAAVVAITKIVRGVTLAWQAAQWLLNIALTMNPIGLIIAAIAALVAGIVIAYKKSDTFRAIIDGLWGAIKTAVKWVGDLIAKLKNIKWPEPPSWLKNAGSAVSGIFGRSAGGTTRSAPGMPRSAGGSSTSSSRVSAGVTINILGALDPEMTARQIRGLLNRSDIRQGSEPGQRLAVAW
jgi:hypothetical protein